MSRRPATERSKLRWWLEDYSVAAWGQLRAWASQASPRDFSTGDLELPLIVLIPGVYERWRYLVPLARTLQRHGYRITVLPGLGNNRRPVPEGTEVVKAELARLAATANQESRTETVILLGHSKGGLIGKNVLLEQTLSQQRAGLGKADSPGLELLGLVAVATPFNGSRYANWARGRTLREFMPESATISRLAAQQEVNSRIVSILPKFDPHIPGDRRLAGASESMLQGTGHFRVLASAEGLAAIIAGIDSLQNPENRLR